MIDPRLLREDPDRLRAAQAKRGLSSDVVDEALAADRARRDAIASFESQRAEQKQIGKLVAERAVAKGIDCVVFDRGGYIYHGRVQALAEGAREGGLKF